MQNSLTSMPADKNMGGRNNEHVDDKRTDGHNPGWGRNDKLFDDRQTDDRVTYRGGSTT